MKKITIFAVAAGLILAVTGTAGATTWYQAGGDRLTAVQQDDGGWDWPLDDGDPTDPSPVNTVGPIAMGLLQAYRYSGDAAHLAALGDAGALLLTKTNNFSPSDGYLAAALDGVFGGTAYTDHVVANFYDPLAAGTYDRNGDGTLYDTAGYVKSIDDARAAGSIGNLAAWDIGMGLYGAAAVGADTTAWVAGVKTEINELDGSKYYDVIGLSGAILGLASVGEGFDPTAGEHEAAKNLSDLADILVAYQLNTGGFTWNSGYVFEDDFNETIQETAYALLALNEFDRAAYLTEILSAGNYLMSVQLGTGGWENHTGSGENNEVTGEALWGIATAVPEPLTMLAVFAGLAGLGGYIRRRRLA